MTVRANQSNRVDRVDDSLQRWSHPAVVKAIVVVREGEAFIDSLASAIMNQSRDIDDLVVVDVGSTSSGTIMDPLTRLRVQAKAAGIAVTTRRLPAGTALADIVAAALNPPPDEIRLPSNGSSETPAVGPAPNEWLWLLHHDSIPAPDALEKLLAAAETSPSAGIIGCKQRDWSDEHRLLDVGITQSRWGAMLTGIERGEVDQGQHDSRSDVLAVRTGGMLVQRELWDTLGGPERGLTGARDDIDLGAMAHAAGYRVVVVPGAVIRHAHCERRQGMRWYYNDRHDAWFQRLGWARTWALPIVALWCVLAAATRAVWRLTLKQPQSALDELTSLLMVFARPLRIIRARRRVSQVTRVPRTVMRSVRATTGELVQYRREELSAWIQPVRSHRTGSRTGGRQWRSSLPVMGFLTAVSIIANWRLVTGSGNALSSMVLLPAGDSALDAWQQATSSWRDIGVGSAAVADPFAVVLAAISFPFGANPQWAVAALLVAGLPLAGLTAWATVSSITGSIWVRSWAALSWALLPPLSAAILGGRPAAVLAHILLPLLAHAIFRCYITGSLASAARAAVLLVVVVAASPSLTVPVAALFLAGAARAAWCRSGRRMTLVILTAGVPALVWLPWWQTVVQNPALLAADPALGMPQSTASWWQLLLVPQSWPATAWHDPQFAQYASQFSAALMAVILTMASAAVVAAVLIMAIISLFRHRFSGFILTAWLVALSALAGAWMVARTALGDGYGWPGPALSMAGLGFLAAAVLATRPGWRISLGGSHRWWLIPAGVIGPAVTAVAIMCVPASDIPLVQRTAAAVVPPLSALESNGPLANRTLVVAADRGTLSWSLLRSAGPRLGDTSAAARLRQPQADDAVVTGMLTALLQRHGADRRSDFAALAIGTVMVSPHSDASLVQALDDATGLVRLSSYRQFPVWRVDLATGATEFTRPAWARLTDGRGGAATALPVTGRSRELDVQLPSADRPRRLVLAERADSRWRATFDGQPIVSIGEDWAQQFLVPSNSGRLQLHHDDGWAGWKIMSVLVMLLAFLMAVPLPRVRHRLAAPGPATRLTTISRFHDSRPLLPAPRVFDETHPRQGYVPPVFSDEQPELAQQRNSVVELLPPQRDGDAHVTADVRDVDVAAPQAAGSDQRRQS